MSEVNEMKSLTLNGTKYESFPDQTARAAAAAKLPSPASAKVGQYLVVEAVDAEGNITKVKTVEAPSGGSDSTQNAVNLLIAILGECATYTDQSANIAALKEALLASSGGDTGGDSGGDSGEDSGSEEVPTVTVTSISAVFNGETAHAGTYASDLDITVTAEYSDGSTATVTDYTISGQVAEGENTFAVIYGGQSCTVTVVGVLAPDWSVYNYTLKDNTPLSTGLTPFANDQSFTMFADITNIHTDAGCSGSIFAVGSVLSLLKRANYNLQLSLCGTSLFKAIGTLQEDLTMTTNDRALIALTHTTRTTELTVDVRIVNASGAADTTLNETYTVEEWTTDTSVMTALSEYYGDRLVCNGAEVYMNYVADADMIAAWLARGDN